MGMIVAMILGGCSLKVVPEQTGTGVINTTENSQTLVRDGLSITVKSSDVDLRDYNLEGSVSAFSVLIDNRTDNEVSFGNDSFVLLDNENRQYLPLTPEKVKEMLSRDSYYLIPYPYVGFYYLEDYAKSSSYNEFSSNAPYYYDLYPQDIYTKALTGESIIPKAKVTGLVYFKIDLSTVKGVKLLVFKKGTSRSSAPDFTFPFKIE
ncbi:MAG TPA: hypothetical protein VFY07_07540 [Geomobilimonas sp.]|nr:hypothetical protein [Geomobilimonas sp.]